MKLKRVLALLMIVFLASNKLKAQLSNSIEIDFLKPIVRSIKNSISDNFYDTENGNLDLKKFSGVGIYYTRSILPNWNIHLKVGLEALHQEYAIPYYVRFSSTKTVAQQYDFEVKNYNLRVGLQKQIPFFSDRCRFLFGIDAVARTQKSHSFNNIKEEIIYSVQSDTVLFSFNSFPASSGGSFVLEFNTGLQLKLLQNLNLTTDCVFAPRYKIGFSYDVTAVQAYWYQGDFYKYIWSDRNLNNEFIIQSLHFRLGLNYRF